MRIRVFTNLQKFLSQHDNYSQTLWRFVYLLKEILYE